MGGIGSGPPPKTKRKRGAKADGMAMPPGYPPAIKPMFEQLVAQLGAHGIQPVDLYALADMAFYQWQKTEAIKQLAAEGITTTDDAHGGERRKHPALTIYRQADMMFQKLAIQFGMTPISRARLIQPEPEENDPYEGFLSGKAGAATKATPGR